MIINVQEGGIWSQTIHMKGLYEGNFSLFLYDGLMLELCQKTILPLLQLYLVCHSFPNQILLSPYYNHREKLFVNWLDIKRYYKCFGYNEKKIFEDIVKFSFKYK